MKARYTLLAIAALVVPLGGCYAYVDPETPVEVVDGDEGYTPLYYQGNVVYYDTVGLPFVWFGTAPFYVPHDYYGYGSLVNHYRYHAHAYHNWAYSHDHHGGGHYGNYGHRHGVYGSRPGGHYG